jgi:hypothetical protein
MTVFVYDHEGLQEPEIIDLIENNKYLTVNIEKAESIYVPDWSDDHPTNKMGVDMNKWWSENYVG